MKLLADLRAIAEAADADGRPWEWGGDYPQCVFRVGDVNLTMKIVHARGLLLSGNHIRAERTLYEALDEDWPDTVKGEHDKRVALAEAGGATSRSSSTQQRKAKKP